MVFLNHIAAAYNRTPLSCPAYRGSMLTGILTAAFVIILSFPGAALASHGKEVAVILSLDIFPYRKALEGAVSELKNSFRLYKLQEQGPEELEKLITENHDGEAILAIGSNALLFATKHFPKRPVIYCMIPNPERLYPDNKYNISGVRMETPWIVVFRHLKEISGESKNIGVIIHSRHSGPQGAETIMAAARDAGLQLDMRRADDVSQALSGFSEMEKKIDAFIMTSDSEIYTDNFFEHIYQSSIKNKFILVGPSTVFTEKGSLISVMGDNFDWGRQAGKMTKILLATENKEAGKEKFAEKYNLSINLKTAKKLDLKIPLKVINSASQIVK